MVETTSKLTPNARHLALGTLSFAVSFAVWGLISAFAPRFRDLFSLSGTQTALLVDPADPISRIQRPAAQVPWFHLVTLLTKVSADDESTAVPVTP